DSARARLLSLARDCACRAAWLDVGLDVGLSLLANLAFCDANSCELRHTPTLTLSIAWPNSPYNNAHQPA
ncbi:MAG TPA: hypothetical protein VFX31_05265, partial [Ktedonobacterales bacterium]|nr:hypothetical protein [Ktedonobacterales bacterium]